MQFTDPNLELTSEDVNSTKIIICIIRYEVSENSLLFGEKLTVDRFTWVWAIVTYIILSHMNYKFLTIYS